MRNKIIISGFLFLAILGFLCCIFWDDLDNFLTGIDSQPMKVVSLVGEIGTSLTSGGKVSADYLSPGKLEINNAFREAHPEFSMTIRNGTSHTNQYFVSAREPDSLEEGFSVIPLSWISLSGKDIVILAGETKEIPITINIPKHLPSKKLMFWFSVKNENSSTVNVELCSKIMVNIR